MKKLSLLLIVLCFGCRCGLFFPDEYKLGITITPIGSGSVTRSPSLGIYDKGTTVKITAIANSGYNFWEWTGNVINARSNPLNIPMTKDKAITAVFRLIGDTDGDGKIGPGETIPDDPENPVDPPIDPPVEPAAFCTYKIDGVLQTENSPGGVFYTGWQGTLVTPWVSWNIPISGLTGTYDEPIAYIYFSDWNGYTYDSNYTNIAGTGPGTAHIVITEYGAVGERIKGTFSGILNECWRTGPPITITEGQFNVIRYPDDTF